MFDGYSSHQVPLIMTILKTQGPILEIGTGHYSTHILHHLCKKEKRPICSLENDMVWMMNFTKYRTDWHNVEYIVDWNDCKYFNQEWSVAFVDHVPGEQRIITIDQIKDKVDFIVVHDTEADHVYHFSQVFPKFKYRYDFKELIPWTTILSNKYDCAI